MRIDQVVKPDAKVMSKLAQDAIDKITLDASKGKFQNDKSGLPYQNDTYRKYKANGMRGIRTGKKLKAYANQSTDTTTSFVNMRLTGRTLRGMRASSKPDTAIITYDRGEIVLGNANRKPNGYDIYDLSDKNKEFIAERFGKELLDRNIKKYVSKTTIIK